MIAGIDEAGRGPLAGPVVAAAVILNPAHKIKGLADSKCLSHLQRERLFDEIHAKAIAVGVGQASVAEIDEMNILQATLLAMRRAVAQLAVLPSQVWVDGNQDPKCGHKTKLYIKGDARIQVISAASIIAKVTRDRLMHALDIAHPGYGFAQHKGYGTKLHMSTLIQLGPTPHHRRSFAPVASLELPGMRQ